MAMLWFLALVLIVALGIFTTWMFSEAVAESDPNERAKWVFIVKFFGPFGAMAYFIERYR